MIDLHTHSEYCQHGRDTLNLYIEEAIEKGIKFLGFSGHFPLPQGFRDPAGDSAMKKHDLKNYLHEINYWKKIIEEKKIKLFKSAEVDYIPEFKEEIFSEVSETGWDYLIGSVHFIGDWNFDFSEEIFKKGLKNLSIEDAYKDYYHLVREMVQTGKFDIVGHLDLIKKFAYFPQTDFDYGLDETLDCIRDYKMVLEVDTAGLDKKIGEIYPSEDILRKARDQGIEITLGSDAHESFQVARHYKTAFDIISKAGYNSLVIPNKGLKIAIPLEQCFKNYHSTINTCA